MFYKKKTPTFSAQWEKEQRSSVLFNFYAGKIFYFDLNHIILALNNHLTYCAVISFVSYQMCVIHGGY